MKTEETKDSKKFMIFRNVFLGLAAGVILFSMISGYVGRNLAEKEIQPQETRIEQFEVTERNEDLIDEVLMEIKEELEEIKEALEKE